MENIMLKIYLLVHITGFLMLLYNLQTHNTSKIATVAHRRDSKLKV